MNRKQSYIVIAILFIASSLAAQTISAAPKPPQLSGAKTVFISNASAGQGIDSDTLYNQAYTAVQQLNRFTIVGTPQEADLILEFDNSVGLGQILRIRDPKSQALLWSVSEYAEGANRAITLEKNRQKAMNQLATDLQRVTASSPTKTN